MEVKQVDVKPPLPTPVANTKQDAPPPWASGARSHVVRATVAMRHQGDRTPSVAVKGTPSVAVKGTPSVAVKGALARPGVGIHTLCSCYMSHSQISDCERCVERAADRHGHCFAAHRTRVVQSLRTLAPFRNALRVEDVKARQRTHVQGAA
jgi:hypothetical protein